MVMTHVQVEVVGAGAGCGASVGASVVGAGAESVGERKSHAGPAELQMPEGELAMSFAYGILPVSACGQAEASKLGRYQFSGAPYTTFLWAAPLWHGICAHRAPKAFQVVSVTRLCHGELVSVDVHLAAKSPLLQPSPLVEPWTASTVEASHVKVIVFRVYQRARCPRTEYVTSTPSTYT
mmetsp:Transcript_121108/g.338012  ORF Transcript_121108/g.338012 Transcript_121108/m.338012 type:complete len:180 (+) Transcript_121108:620-1159(+)